MAKMKPGCCKVLVLVDNLPVKLGFLIRMTLLTWWEKLMQAENQIIVHHQHSRTMIQHLCEAQKYFVCTNVHFALWIIKVLDEPQMTLTQVLWVFRDGKYCDHREPRHSTNSSHQSHLSARFTPNFPKCNHVPSSLFNPLFYTILQSNQ